MELATVRVSTSEHNEVIKRDVTPAEAVILARLHTEKTKGKPIGLIIVTGDEPRETLKERERLGLRYTGTIGHGKDVKPALIAVFPNEMDELPETFDEVLKFLGSGAEVTNEEELKAVEEAKKEASAKVAEAKAKAKAKTAKGKAEKATGSE